MVFRTRHQKNKALVYAAVPPEKEGIKVLEWLTAALAPLNGKGGRGFLMWVGNISHTF